MNYIRAERGFTLVELIITAAFVAVSSTAIVEIFVVVGKLNKQSRNMAVATAMAEQKIESYRNSGFSSIPVGAPAETFTTSLPANFGSPKSAVTNVSEAQAGLKQVDVVIAYTEDGHPKRVQTSTLMADRGIDR